MQPIYNELIKMWQDNGFEYPIFEGYFWLDNQIVKGFNKKSGKIEFLYKIKISDDLKISFSKHKNCPNIDDIKFETWQETSERIKPVFYSPKYFSII